MGPLLMSLLGTARAHDGLVATALDVPAASVVPDPTTLLGLLGALAVARLGRRWLPVFFLGQLLSPGLALGGVALLYLGRQALVGEVRWPWAAALLAGLALPAGSFPLELVALLPLTRVERPLSWLVGVAGGWALWTAL